jgi:hypothetical protein
MWRLIAFKIRRFVDYLLKISKLFYGTWLPVLLNQDAAKFALKTLNPIAVVAIGWDTLCMESRNNKSCSTVSRSVD